MWESSQEADYRLFILKVKAIQQSCPLLKHTDQYSDLVYSTLKNTELCSASHSLLPINNAAY